MMQWKCKTCGQWVSMNAAAHYHVVEAAPNLQAMIAGREAGIDATDLHRHQERWTPAHETRKAPDDCP